MVCFGLNIEKICRTYPDPLTFSKSPKVVKLTQTCQTYPDANFCRHDCTENIKLVQSFKKSNFQSLLESDTLLTSINESNAVEVGEDVFVELFTMSENAITIVDRCWVTPDDDSDNDEVSIDLYQNDCKWTEIDWVKLDDRFENVSFGHLKSFKFKAFRFSGQNSFWLHCQVDVCRRYITISTVKCS